MKGYVAVPLTTPMVWPGLRPLLSSRVEYAMNIWQAESVPFS